MWCWTGGLISPGGLAMSTSTLLLVELGKVMCLEGWLWDMEVDFVSSEELGASQLFDLYIKESSDVWFVFPLTFLSQPQKLSYR